MSASKSIRPDTARIVLMCFIEIDNQTVIFITFFGDHKVIENDN